MTAASQPPRIDAPWLLVPGRARVFAALAAKGHRARAVGGAVRNTLLGLVVADDDDVDIATSATPDETIAAAKAAGLKALPTGLAHGTVTFVVDGIRTEVTTLRRDVESHGRHATVAFTTDWSDDAARRDFTMNALYCDADGTLFDPLGGYADLAARRVRFIGDPHQRIREDFLRILRFFRFNAQHGLGATDPEGLTACISEREGLIRLSGERIAQEMQKLLVARRGPEIVSVMYDHGLLASVLGRAPRLSLFEHLAACEAANGAAPDFVRRLAALAVQVEEDGSFLQSRLKLSNSFATRLQRLATVRETRPPEGKDARTLLYHLGREAYRDHMLLAWARSGTGEDNQLWLAALSLPGSWQAPRFPIDGADALRAGIAPGPQMGEALRAVEAAWIASDFSITRDRLIALLTAQART